MEDPQVGDHWTYQSRDDITGDVKSTFTATVTDITESEISLRTNVIGNSLATAVVAKWEGQLIADEDTTEMIEEMEVEPA